MQQPSRVSRRSFLRAAGQAAFVGGLASSGLLALDSDGIFPGTKTAKAAASERPLVWVWKFSVDGDLGAVSQNLAANNLGAILKTFDGVEWMTRFDKVPEAITGPDKVERAAAIFEQAGVPFHAWFVAQGREPIWEARMASDVLNAGARSIYIDLEPPEGSNYWQGSPQDALIFGQELRRLQPNARVVIAPDARPWQVPKVPLAEYMSFANAVAPQSYWETFNSPTNLRYLRERGFPVGDDGFTPELVVDVALSTFQGYGLPIEPIGQGAAPPDHWYRFIQAAAGRGMSNVSMWRYGSADPGAFGVMRDMFPVEQAPAPEVVAPTEVPTAAPTEAPASPVREGFTASDAETQASTATPEPTTTPATKQEATPTPAAVERSRTQAAETPNSSSSDDAEADEPQRKSKSSPKAKRQPKEALVSRVLTFLLD